MTFKIVAAVVAGLLLMLFISPVVIKLEDVALSVVVLIGIVLMVADIWQSLREKD